jgi:small subunit ribosomal protein S9
MLQPLAVVGQEGTYDISVHVSGGGVTGQRDAVRLGVARALLEIDAEFRAQLKPAKLLTRDAREKERKKPGLKRARKAPTYTKR